MKSERRKLRKISENVSDNDNDDNANSLYLKSKQNKIKEESDLIFNNSQKNNYDDNTNKEKSIEIYKNSKLCEICKKNANINNQQYCLICDDLQHDQCVSDQQVFNEDNEFICPLCKPTYDKLIDKFEQEQIGGENVIYKVNKCQRCQNKSTEFLNIVEINVFNDNPFIEKCCNKCKQDIYNLNNKKPSILNQYISIKNQNHTNYQLNFSSNEPDSELSIYKPFSSIELILQQQESIKACLLFQDLIWVNELVQSDSKIQNENNSLYSYENILKQSDQFKNSNFIKSVDIECNHINQEPQVQPFTNNNLSIQYQMKKLQEKLILPPVIIKKDKTKGYVVYADEYIPSLTIICEYLGQVVLTRDILFDKNDSIMELLRSPSSKHSLSIYPNKFANLAKFFSGINNNMDDEYRYTIQNLSSIRVKIKDEIKVILQTIKDIEKGELMSFNYNDGGLDQQDTTQFI